MSRLPGGAPALLAAGALAALACANPPPLVYLNTTPSMPEGFYLAVPGRPAEGDLAVLPSRAILSYGLRLPPSLLKEVAACRGEPVVIDDAGLFLEGRLRARRAMRRGSSFSGTLPAGYAIVLGRNPRSFDSRYFGPISVDELRKVVPLLTWPRSAERKTGGSAPDGGGPASQELAGPHIHGDGNRR